MHDRDNVPYAHASFVEWNISLFMEILVHRRSTESLDLTNRHVIHDE